MKTLLIILLFVSTMAFGQGGTVEGFSFTPSNTVTKTLISIQFSPSSEDSLSFDVIRDMCKQQFGGKDYFTAWYRNVQVQNKHHNSPRYIEVRVILNRVTTDYTFDEFKNLIWP